MNVRKPAAPAQATLWRAVLCAVCLFGAQAHAHKASDSFLTLDARPDGVTARLDVALLDLEQALGLDANVDGAITWAEVKARHNDIAAYVLARLKIADAHGDCALRPGSQRIARHSDGAYTAVPIEAGCRAPSEWLRVEYGLLFDLDSGHRSLVRFNAGGSIEAVQSRVLSPAQRQVRFELGEARSPQRLFSARAWRAATDYLREGIRHVWTGIDHIAFLLTLLLPVMLAANLSAIEGRPAGAAGAAVRRTVTRVLILVTTFTVAHSLTLAPAALGWIALPSRFVESAIAASVVVVALANFFPGMHSHRLPLVFGFGLVHGLGFASALGDLGLPPDAIGISLAAFNVGVEAGQIAIVAGVVPLMWIARRRPQGADHLLRYGSAGAALVACGWLIERWFEVELFAV